MGPDQASTSPAARPPLPLTRRGFLGTGAMAGAALAVARQALPPLGAAEPEHFNFFVTDQVRVPGLRADYAALRRLDSLADLRGRARPRQPTRPRLPRARRRAAVRRSRDRKPMATEVPAPNPPSFGIAASAWREEPGRASR